MLHEDQYRELLALYSYLIWHKSCTVPLLMVYLISSRNDFKDFVDVYFDKSKPIICSEDGELLKQHSIDEQWRDDTDRYDNSDSTPYIVWAIHVIGNSFWIHPFAELYTFLFMCLFV